MLCVNVLGYQNSVCEAVVDQQFYLLNLLCIRWKVNIGGKLHKRK